jgi:hypothetical protein
MQRIGHEQQIGRLKPGTFLRALDLRADVPGAADRQIRLVGQELQCLAGDIQEVRDLPRFAGWTELARPLAAE